MVDYNLRKKKDPVTYDDLINLFDEKLIDIATKKMHRLFKVKH